MQQKSSNASAEATPSSSDTNVAAAAAALTPLNLEILKVVKESQQQHGLRHSDYQRYRHYCSRRLRRLRKTMHVSCGTTKRFAKREIQIEDLAQATDNKLLLIPLFLSERAWALAMQLKQEANTEPRKKFHLMNRMRKAVRFARHIETLAQSPRCDARTKLEAQGYASLINGQFCFENQQWKDSLTHFNVAKNIYVKLSDALKGDDSQVYYSQKVDEIEPNIRYCNYKLGDKSAKKDLIDMKMKSGAGSELADAIDNLILQTKEKQTITFSEVVWRNKITLQVKNEKVRIFLLNVQEYEKQIQSSSDLDVKISIYENILKESVDTIQLVRDELKLDQHFQTIQRGQVLQPEDKPSNLLLLFSYLTWVRINKTIERNLLMVDSMRAMFSKQQQQQQSDPNTKNAKPQNIVRLYDIILQNFKDISNLPGVLYDQKAQSDIELQCQYYRTFRAYYIALHYFQIKKYVESSGFCLRVDSYVKDLEPMLSSALKKAASASSGGGELDAEKLREFESEVKQLREDVNECKRKLQTSIMLAKMSMIGIGDPSAPLSERLDAYFSEQKTTKSTKTTKATKASNANAAELTPSKPLFFDLALNYVELPSYDDKIDAKKQQPAGVKGFIKGFFGF